MCYITLQLPLPPSGKKIKDHCRAQALFLCSPSAFHINSHLLSVCGTILGVFTVVHPHLSLIVWKLKIHFLSRCSRLLIALKPTPAATQWKRSHSGLFSPDSILTQGPGLHLVVLILLAETHSLGVLLWISILNTCNLLTTVRVAYLRSPRLASPVQHAFSMFAFFTWHCHLQIKVLIVFLISLGRWNLSTVLQEAGCDELSMIICSPVTSRHAHAFLLRKGAERHADRTQSWFSCLHPVRERYKPILKVRVMDGGFQESLSNRTMFLSAYTLPSFTIGLHSSRSAMVNLTEVQQTF